jgi:hypothetical protein
MKAQTKSELDWKKKELGRLHKLGILKDTISRKPKSISIVSVSDAMEERDYSGAAVNTARAVDVFFFKRGQVLQ